MITPAPEYSLIIISHCPYWGQGSSVLRGSADPFLGVVLAVIVKMLSISPVLPGFQGGCREGAEQRIQIQTGNRDAQLLSCFVVNSWAQVRSWLFLAVLASSCFILWRMGYQLFNISESIGMSPCSQQITVSFWSAICCSHPFP
jgi:hypothetical protein